MFAQNKTNNMWGKWIAVTLVLGIAAFLTSPIAPLGGFWGLSTDGHMPEGIQKGLFILLTIIQSLALGFGFAFLLLDGKRKILSAYRRRFRSGSVFGNCLVLAELVASYQPAPDS